MKIIQAETINEIITPVEPLPTAAKMILFNGTGYVIYEEGDEIPAEFIGE